MLQCSIMVICTLIKCTFPCNSLLPRCSTNFIQRYHSVVFLAYVHNNVGSYLSQPVTKCKNIIPKSDQKTNSGFRTELLTPLGVVVFGYLVRQKRTPVSGKTWLVAKKILSCPILTEPKTLCCAPHRSCGFLGHCNNLAGIPGAIIRFV